MSASVSIARPGNNGTENIVIASDTMPAAADSCTGLPAAGSSFAHDWSNSGTGGKLQIRERHIVDAYGRVCNLRGVNLSGSSKHPANHDNDKFPREPESVTFVGRPFPISEAHDHFARLRRWGFTFIRFLITWEAVEHAGPEQYDTEYLAYVRSLLSLLPQYGITAIIDMHQDVWSRYSGGSGAPAWTLEAVGFDLEALEEAHAAWLRGVKGGGHTEDERGIWPCGYQKLAAATMATCFWAGDTFAPKIRVNLPSEGMVSIQTFLQTTFLSMFDEVVKYTGDLPGVLGYEIMNEPHRGYIDLKSMNSFDYNTDLHLAYVPSAFQSFMLGAGYPTPVAHWTRSFPLPTRHTSTDVLNVSRRKVWRDDGPTGGDCLWAMHAVWAWDNVKKCGVVLRENYFAKSPISGKPIDWYSDFYFPFVLRWSRRVLSRSSPEKLLFVEQIPNEFCPPSWATAEKPKNMVYAPHWYDLNALFTKSYGDFTVNVQGLSRGMFFLKALYWGQKGARDNYALQIRNIIESGHRVLGELPIIIGECGVPMDMNNRESFRTEDFVMQARMFDSLISALDAALVGFTLWNYNRECSDAKGDHWNGENFSWFSSDRALPSSLLYHEQTAVSLDQGGRILNSIVRPYPAKTAGVPVTFKYEMNTGTFEYTWTAADFHQEKAISTLAHQTEIFIPHLLTQGRQVIVSGLSGNNNYVYVKEHQTLYISTPNPVPGRTFAILVSLEPPLQPSFRVNGFLDDFLGLVMALCIAIFALFAYYYIAM